MPRRFTGARRRYNNRRRKRTWRRKRNPNTKHQMVMNYADRPENRTITKFFKPIPFPLIKRVKLSYSGTVNLNSTTGSTLFGTSKAFYLNSLYSPEVSGGHQPYGYDQLCAATLPYDRYKVNGCKVKLMFVAPGGGDNESAMNSIVAGCIVNNPTQSVDISGKGISYISETNMSQVVHVPATGSQHGVIAFYMPMYKAFNWGKKDYQRDVGGGGTTAEYNASPGSLVKMYIATANLRASTTVTTVYCHYEFTFYAELYSRNILSQS